MSISAPLTTPRPNSIDSRTAIGELALTVADLDRSIAFYTGPLGFDGSDPGGLYRALRSLEKEKLVRSVWEPSETGPDRRTYEITRAGMEELHRNAKAVAAGQDTVATFLSRYEEFVALPRPSRRPSRSSARDTTSIS